LGPCAEGTPQTGGAELEVTREPVGELTGRDLVGLGRGTQR
jgi:hypothetical protein